MNYHPKNKKQGGGKKILITGVSILVVFFLIRSFIPVFASNVTNVLVSPFLKTRDGIYSSTEGFLNYFSSKSKLKNENEELKKDVESLEFRILNMRLVEEENLSLRDLVSLEEKDSGFKTLRIISKPPFSPYDYFILNGGRNSGVEIGQKVYSQDDIILGEIVESYGNTSKARLYSSYGNETEVKIEGTGAFLLAKGRGMGNFRIEAPREIVLTRGSLITLPDDNGKILGQIYSVTAGPTDPFQLVLARYPVNILELTFVRIR